MPGRDETIPEFITAAKALGIDTIFCLASTDEIQVKSLGYGKALAAGTMSFTHISFPIPDFGIPDTMEAHCVLVELGVSPADAYAAVREAGSGSETTEQRSLVGGFRKR
jgi:hypothetical protein